jgi:hypothetical protein
MSKCKYCNSAAYGRVYDNRHPNNVHVHQPDGKHCIYCGTTATGCGHVYDNRHPDNLHEIQ